MNEEIKAQQARKTIEEFNSIITEREELSKRNYERIDALKARGLSVYAYEKQYGRFPRIAGSDAYDLRDEAHDWSAVPDAMQDALAEANEVYFIPFYETQKRFSMMIAKLESLGWLDPNTGAGVVRIAPFVYNIASSAVTTANDGIDDASEEELAKRGL